MTAAVWDPERYLTYADERGRPFVELVSRIGAAAPGRVVDLGCGPGNLTALLAERWPTAEISGVDSSPEMVATARARGDGVGYEVGDIATWQPAAPVDVLVSNAALQWLPGHLDLLPGLLEHVAPGGWFAFQVPGNFDEASHTVRRALEQEEPYASALPPLDRPGSHDPAVYLRALEPHVASVDAWETTYLHVLQGADPVFTWISATSARPVLGALPDDLRPRFVEELKARLREAYPDDGYGVVMPFRRVFVVAQSDAEVTQR
ncbi:methyltransferase domain-containing protein [Nocardioides mangrovicus]|uniref:Trans-aconitate 2-methyltransferase n=1 Tax=Nocardioides mangrovicus TaxID=2478913 RepID=A0A3L8P0Q1_9ACTN|nr:methyltransferase domain-containing protein [Nocardioides mangrovicus]RLV48497.1 methyltransferase domain-containing protein [Nocardioides mangrovicus]